MMSSFSKIREMQPNVWETIDRNFQGENIPSFAKNDISSQLPTFRRLKLWFKRNGLIRYLQYLWFIIFYWGTFDRTCKNMGAYTLLSFLLQRVYDCTFRYTYEMNILLSYLSDLYLLSVTHTVRVCVLRSTEELPDMQRPIRNIKKSTDACIS